MLKVVSLTNAAIHITCCYNLGLLNIKRLRNKNQTRITIVQICQKWLFQALVTRSLLKKLFSFIKKRFEINFFANFTTSRALSLYTILTFTSNQNAKGSLMDQLQHVIFPIHTKSAVPSKTFIFIHLYGDWASAHESQW